MITCKTLIHELQSGAYDEPLSRLYALDGAQKSLDMAQDRTQHYYEHDRWNDSGIRPQGGCVVAE